MPVGYVDAYFEFVDHPRVTAACDVMLANCYPFWEGCPAEHALLYMKEMYRRVAERRRWQAGHHQRDRLAEPRHTRRRARCRRSKTRSSTSSTPISGPQQDGIEIFYFSSFDETWKVDAEGDVGAYWGLWDKDGKPKYV